MYRVSPGYEPDLSSNEKIFIAAALQKVLGQHNGP